MNIREELEKLKEGLVLQRDELRVKVSLAKMEVRDEWDKAEEKMDRWLCKLEDIGGEAADASEDVMGSAKHLGEEIKTAYERIKKHL
ncbi:MAG: hypothetical protein PHE55_19925 [Methylococcaceae bacterium]|nr:hypothetical protein [Methylococcaceae bacterium]